MPATMIDFGTLKDGRGVRQFVLRSGDLEARILDYGSRLTMFARDGGPSAAVGSERLSDYEGRLHFAGPIVAPVINRIGGASAALDGRHLHFDPNQDGHHTLHSGRVGTQKAIWDLIDATEAALVLSALLPDGDGGFPGNRRITADWRLGDALELELTATTDAPTFLNPGLHGVWNPDGDARQSDLRLEIPADRFLPSATDNLPTGAIAEVAGTVFDHRTGRAADPALDNNYCFDTTYGLRARLAGPSGRRLAIYSDAPGLQAYAGGADGIALEPQLWPDAPNRSDFPSIVLRPEETFRQCTRVVLEDG